MCVISLHELLNFSMSKIQKQRSNVSFAWNFVENVPFLSEQAMSINTDIRTLVKFCHLTYAKEIYPCD